MAIASVAALLVTATWAAPDPEEDAAREERRYLERLRAARETPAPERAATTGEREAAREAFLARADELIRDKNYRSGGTDAYLVKTDDPRLDVGAVADLLTSFRAAFDRFWQDRVELLPCDEASRMYLFWSYYKYNQLFSGKARFDEFRTAGHYRGVLDTIVIHTDGTPPGDLADVLVHEAAHQRIRQCLAGPDAELPPWLDEGLAEYFAYTRQEAGGRFAFGEVGGKSVWPFREGKPSRATAARTRRDAALRRLADGGGGTVDGLLRAGGPAFYGDGIEANYGASWLLVRFLLDGDGGRHADAFAAWIRDDLRGGGGRALPDALGLDAGSLDEALARHAKSLKIR